MKKILAMLLALMLCVSMIACSNDGDKKDDDKEETTAATTEAPAATTEAPAATTEAPAATTEAPVVTTEAPVVTTEAPVVTTEAPVVTTEAPVVTTEAPVATDDPVAVVYADYEDAVDAFVGAMSSGDADTYYNVMIDKYYAAANIEDMDEFMADLEEEVAAFDGYDLSYAILDAYDFTAEELVEADDWLVSLFGYPENVLEGAVFAEIALTIENEEEEETAASIFAIIKVDGNWYVSMPLSMLMSPISEEDVGDEVYVDDEEYTEEDVYTDGENYYVDGYIFDEEGNVVGTYEEDENGDYVVNDEE